MRILLLSDRIPPENKGGAEAAAWNLARGLHQAGHDVHVIAATPDQPFEEVREGIHTYHVYSRYRNRFRAFLSLYNPQTINAVKTLYQRIQPEIVNAHNIHYDLSYYALTAAHKMGIGTVFSSHDVMPFAYAKLIHWVNPERCGVESPEEYRLPRGYSRRLMRFRYNPFRNVIIRHILSKHTNIRVTPSDALRQAHLANDMPAPYEVVPYGFDVANFKASEAAQEQLRERLELAGRKVILFAGRLTGAKGVKEILAALSRIVEDVPEALLLVLTAGSIDEQVQQPEFRHLKESHIRSGGWLTGEDLIAAYHLADVVTVPSIIMDTFPVVNLEGMAAGKPVVSTCYGGSPEAVVDGKTGYIINPFDTEQFAERLVQLLRDDDLRGQMGEAAKEHVQTTFPIQRQVREMVALYEQARFFEPNESPVLQG